jgi:hypothetical protein
VSADDFLLGFVGSKSEAEEIKSEHLRAMWLAGENPGASRSRGSKTCTAGTERETSLGQGDGSSPPQGPRRLRRASTRTWWRSPLSLATMARPRWPVSLVIVIHTSISPTSSSGLFPGAIARNGTRSA